MFVDTETKICTKCGQEKRLTEFYSGVSYARGICTRCKACIKAYSKRYQEMNREQQREYDRRYKKRHRQKILEKARKASRTEEGRKKRRLYWLKNKEKFHEWARAYRGRHQASESARCNRNDKTRRKAKGQFSQQQWEVLCSFFDSCPCCNKVEVFTIDHIIPVSKGGTHWIDNIQPICFICNSTKCNRHSTDYRPQHVREWAQGEMARTAF